MVLKATNNTFTWFVEQNRFQIRRAQLQDLKALSAVLADCFYPLSRHQSWFASIIKVGIYEDLKQRLRSRSPYYACWVVLQAPIVEGLEVNPVESPHSTVVGSVELDLRRSPQTHWSQWLVRNQWPSLGIPKRHSSSCLYISNLAVHPASRRQGIASHLLEICEQTARHWGFQETYLHVLEDNTQAQKLYNQAGYQLVQTDTGWETFLLGKPRRLLMHKTARPLGSPLQ